MKNNNRKAQVCDQPLKGKKETNKNDINRMFIHVNVSRKNLVTFESYFYCPNYTETRSRSIFILLCAYR